MAQEWEDVGESYVHRRMKELGIPDDQIGQPDYDGDGRWRAFSPRGQTGGEIRPQPRDVRVAAFDAFAQVVTKYEDPLYGVDVRIDADRFGRQPPGLDLYLL